MITTFLVISYLSGVAALIDQIRWPASQWTAADRNRGWWIGWTVTLGLIACGLFVAVAYLLAVVPAFGRPQVVDSDFRRQR